MLELKNKALLCKWLFKLLNEEGVWQELLTNKYLQNKPLSQVQANPTDSAFWKGLMRVKEEFFSRGSFVIGNGQNTRFWEDKWLGDAPLSQQYPSLYNIVQRKNVSVASVLQGDHPNLAFRRALTGNKWERWLHLVHRLMDVQFSDEKDSFIWGLTDAGKYTTKSMYLDLLNGHTPFLRKYIWKLKVPLKIRIFMWFMYRRVLLTKVNLSRKNWQGSTKCCFCDKAETVQHLFISCPMAQVIWRIVYMAFNIIPPKNITNLFGNWLSGVTKKDKSNIRVGVCALLWAIWHVRNDIIFNNSKVSSFLQVIPLATHWIRTWSFLQPLERRQDMDFGSNRLELVAREFFNQYGWQLNYRLSC